MKSERRSATASKDVLFLDLVNSFMNLKRKNKIKSYITNSSIMSPKEGSKHNKRSHSHFAEGPVLWKDPEEAFEALDALNEKNICKYLEKQELKAQGKDGNSSYAKEEIKEARRKVIKEYSDRITKSSFEEGEVGNLDVFPYIGKQGMKRHIQKTSKFKFSSIPTSPKHDSPQKRIGTFCEDPFAFYIYKNREGYNKALEGHNSINVSPRSTSQNKPVKLYDDLFGLMQGQKSTNKNRIRYPEYRRILSKTREVSRGKRENRASYYNISRAGGNQLVSTSVKEWKSPGLKEDISLKIPTKPSESVDQFHITRFQIEENPYMPTNTEVPKTNHQKFEDLKGRSSCGGPVSIFSILEKPADKIQLPAIPYELLDLTIPKNSLKEAKWMKIATFDKFLLKCKKCENPSIDTKKLLEKRLLITDERTKLFNKTLEKVEELEELGTNNGVVLENVIKINQRIEKHMRNDVEKEKFEYKKRNLLPKLQSMLRHSAFKKGGRK